MDNSFFSQRLLTIARHTYQNICLKKDRRYYHRYVCKLSYNLEYLNTQDIDQLISFVEEFKDKQSKRIKNGIFIKPKNMLVLACRDTKDVLESMQRFDGTGTENWNRFWNNWEVNFGRMV